MRLDRLSDDKRSALRRDRFVFQSGQLVPELTAEENVALPLLLSGRCRVRGRRDYGHRHRLRRSSSGASIAYRALGSGLIPVALIRKVWWIFCPDQTSRTAQGRGRSAG
jgi:hypothetical protein